MLERVRDALASEYDVEDELAGGGMGVVFAARHRRLDRRVAIKILRPELATAVAAERFLAEGRILARLSHPSIVPVYDAGEAAGLLYCVMEFIEGETLADRLERGPLLPAECRQLTADLLSALRVAHRENIVHRDVTPQNIFLRQGRALLGDFGIAHWHHARDESLTVAGQLIGTPSYMPPEQLVGGAVTPRTDVYAAGMVLYESWTGRRWSLTNAPTEGDWSAVPSGERTAIRGALAADPAARWSDAGAFQSRFASGHGAKLPLIATALLLLLALGGWLLWPSPPPPSASARGALMVAVERFRTDAVTPGSLADSVTIHLRRALAGYPDFDVPAAGDRRADSAAVSITGTVTDSAGRVRITASVSDRAGGGAERVSREGLRAAWEGVAEEVALAMVRGVFTRSEVGDLWLPKGAMPESPSGFDLWLRAEQYLAQARWEEARSAYLLALQADSTCYLCSFRLLDIDRWLGLSHDPAEMRRLRMGMDRFPDHYRSLIRGALAPLPARLDTLAAAARPGEFFLASFEYGDELFHRGPLYGFSRTEARAPLQQSVRLRPRFGPGWEHLTWLLLSTGDAASARGALATLSSLPEGSAAGFSAALRVFLTLGYRWRFLPPDSARAYSAQVLAIPGIAEQPGASAGARLLMTADAPRGAVEFGGMLASAWSSRPEAMDQGHLGQLFGYAALGRLDSLRATALALNRTSTDPSLGLLGLELEAVLRAFDPDSSIRRAPDLLRALDAYATPAAPHLALRTRALWASGILASRNGDTSRAADAETALAAGPATLRGLLIAARLSSRGDFAGALAAIPPMPSLESPAEHADPLQDAVARLLSAELHQRLGRIAQARRDLLWYEHLQVIGHGGGAPAPGEMAWALGTLARWRLANLPTGAGALQERCAALHAVIRNWTGAGPPFDLRVLDARKALLEERCGG